MYLCALSKLLNLHDYLVNAKRSEYFVYFGAKATVLGFIVKYAVMVKYFNRRSVMGMGMKHRRLVSARSAPLNRNAPSCVCNGCSILVFLREHTHLYRGYSSVSIFIRTHANLGYLVTRTSFLLLIECLLQCECEFYCR